MERKNLLLVTDFYYQAKGREYFREDLELSSYLRKHFRLSITHIKDMDFKSDEMDLVLLRNTGPKTAHALELSKLKAECKKPISNDLNGKGDILGKGHLLELYHLGYPVIPTIDSFSHIHLLGNSEKYLIKPKNGSDSNGVNVLSKSELAQVETEGFVIQPHLEFEYEVSFYFIDDSFQYALYAPDQTARWKLEIYPASEKDLEFARKFVTWNSCRHGIQRVDACRLSNGELLLMELEDYNPYLSIDKLTKNKKEDLIENLSQSLFRQLDSNLSNQRSLK